MSAPEPIRIFLLGPTCSGKSEVGARVAERLGGDVVSTDSMQVYRGLPVLTAQPTADQLARAPHHLLAFVEPAARFDVFAWTRAVLDVLARLDAAGRPAVFVGGTWYYFRALVDGFDDLPAGDDEVRRAVAAEAGPEPGALHRALLSVDPVTAARLHPNDERRIVRALEIHRLTGHPMSELVGAPRSGPVRSYRAFALQLDRDELYRRIDARVDAMLALGALDEVRALLGAGLPPEATVFQALGVRQLAAHARGERPLEQAVLEWKRDTRHYARRQLGYLRRDARLEPVAADAAVAAVLSRAAQAV